MEVSLGLDQGLYNRLLINASTYAKCAQIINSHNLLINTPIGIIGITLTILRPVE